ncbi:MAG: serine/threonine-protein kinase [Gammaproteobacteria bacterium]|jgi:serine/threonine protein kinase
MSHSSNSNGFDTTFHTVPAPPSFIGKYEILEEVGKGTMGTVYAAYDPFCDRRVAIKVAHPYLSRADEGGKRFRKLFFNEVHAAGVLDHPNIISLYDADVDNKMCYLVMEFIEGAQTLLPFCKADNLLPLRDVVGVVFKCAKALDYAHRQGIIHRDIKPSNILLTAERDVRLSDFSIARINRPDLRSTQFEGFLGSPMYMSPEQINEREIGTNSDIFSLGVVMYEMLTGSHPFRSDSLSAVARRVTGETPRSITEFRSDVPEGLEYVLGRMLEKNSAERYPSGLELAADIALIFDDLEKLETEDTLNRKFDSLKHLGFFRGFNDVELWSLVRASNWQVYAPGEVVIREGETDHSFYILLSGVVTVEKGGQVMDNLKEGDCFGEMGFLSNTERTASVIAKTDTSMIRLNASTLERADPATQNRFLKVFVETLIGRLKHTTSALARMKPA